MQEETEQKDTRFQPGQSGNPNGRPAGARTRIALALDTLSEADGEKIVRAMIEKAKNGDSQAGRVILERIWPARKGARVQFNLPTVTKAEELPAAFASISRQVADGDISPEEGSVIVTMLEAQRKAIETSDLAERLAALEARMK